MRTFLLLAFLVTSCAPSAPTNAGNVGILVITAGGNELSDGSTDVPTTLDLHISGGRTVTPDEVGVHLDATELTPRAANGGVDVTSAPQKLASHHRIVVRVDSTMTTYAITIVAPTSAMAAVHADGTQTDLDVAFSAPPQKAAVSDAAHSINLVWLDDEHAHATWTGLPVASFNLSSSLPTAGGSHLAAALHVDLSAPPVGTLRRVDVPTPPAAHPKILGYAVGTSASIASTTAHIADLAVVSPTGWRVDAQGTLTGSPVAPEAQAATAAGVGLLPVVQNNASDPTATGAFVTATSTAAGSAQLGSTLIGDAQAVGAQGIQFDIEGIPATNRDGYTALVKQLALVLHGAGLKLIVDVVPHKPDSLNIYSAGYDIPAIARAADDIVLLAYDEHTQSGDPGPVAGYDWDQRLLSGSLTGLDTGKVWLGVPLYARTWQDQNVVADSYSSALAAALGTPGAVVNEDFAAHTPFITYTPAGESVAVTYFDDALSLQWKESLVAAHGLAGVAAWRLGFEDPQWW